jgi:hypothetical protein
MRILSRLPPSGDGILLRDSLHAILKFFAVKYEQGRYHSPDRQFLPWKWTTHGVESRPSFWRFSGLI